MEVFGIKDGSLLEATEEFLSYIGIYEDNKRRMAYTKWLEKNEHIIRNKAVVEAGAGFGVFSQVMLEIGARKVYAVERNPLMAEYLREKFSGTSNLVVVESPVEDFEPEEDITLLVHEFYGSMLYDENLSSLERLKFSPEVVFPDQGALCFSVVDIREYLDDVVDESVISLLEEGLFSEIFVKDYAGSLEKVAALWSYQGGLKLFHTTISTEDKVFAGSGILKLKQIPREFRWIVFGIEILHEGEKVITTAEADNWSFVWTPVKGTSFTLEFEEYDVFINWE